MDTEILYALVDKYTMLVEYDASDNPEYIGEATPGTAQGDPVWRIRKVTYTGGNPTGIEWAEGTTEFNKVWDDRGDYDYS